MIGASCNVVQLIRLWIDLFSFFLFFFFFFFRIRFMLTDLDSRTMMIL